MSLSLLKLYTADTSAPYNLNDTQLQEILDRNDDILAAAAEVWRIKAGTVADWYDASIDGAGLSRQQVWEHCIEMMKHYDEKSPAQMTNFRTQVTPVKESEVSEFG